MAAPRILRLLRFPCLKLSIFVEVKWVARNNCDKSEAIKTEQCGFIFGQEVRYDHPNLVVGIATVRRGRRNFNRS